MAKKNKKDKEEKIKEEINPKLQVETQENTEKYILLELVQLCPVETPWIIYNLSRAGLLEQYEQEIQDYGRKHIEPTLTIEEFDKIIKGKQ